MKNILALALEARRAIRHDAFALRCSNLAAEVGLARPTEFAFSAFGSATESSTGEKEHVMSDILESNDIVAGLHCGDALADRLNNACAFVSEYDWERAFRIFARQRVRICELMSNENKKPTTTSTAPV